MLYITIAILAGVSIVVARIINANLAKKIGNWEGTFLIILLAYFLYVIFNFQFRFNVYSNAYVTIHTYRCIFRGLVGVIVISLSNYITPKISAFYLTLLIFIGQLFAGLSLISS